MAACRQEGLACALPANACNLSARPRATGERLNDWAWFRLFRRRSPGDRWLIDPPREPDEFVYYVVFGRANTPLSMLARVAGQRWTVERCSEVAKAGSGPDADEVRCWHSWYRHTTMAMLAFAFLAATSGRLRPREAASHKMGEGCLVRPGRLNVGVIAAPSGRARASAISPA